MNADWDAVHVPSVYFIFCLLVVQLEPVMDTKWFEIKPHYDMEVEDLCREQNRDRVVYLFNEPSKS